MIQSTESRTRANEDDRQHASNTAVVPRCAADTIHWQHVNLHAYTKLWLEKQPNLEPDQPQKSNVECEEKERRICIIVNKKWFATVYARRKTRIVRRQCSEWQNWRQELHVTCIVIGVPHPRCTENFYYVPLMLFFALIYLSSNSNKVQTFLIYGDYCILYIRTYHCSCVHRITHVSIRSVKSMLLLLRDYQLSNFLRRTSQPGQTFDQERRGISTVQFLNIHTYIASCR